MLKNNLISILDQTFPGANTLFNTPARRTDGHEKWIDFVLRFPHCECVSKKSLTFICRSCSPDFMPPPSRRTLAFLISVAVHFLLVN